MEEILRSGRGCAFIMSDIFFSFAGWNQTMAQPRGRLPERKKTEEENIWNIVPWAGRA